MAAGLVKQADTITETALAVGGYQAEGFVINFNLFGLGQAAQVGCHLLQANRLEHKALGAADNRFRQFV
jgi:hypothetical protein